MVAINLKGKTAFVAGVGDDQGFGWAIAKALRESGAEVIIGVWTPMLRIFTTALESGKYDESRKLQNGGMLEFAGIYPMDAVFDVPEDVPEDIKENKRYKEVSSYTISEMVEKVKQDGFSHIDMLVHALANAPEVKKQLMDTSRKGYLSAMSSSTYSFISLLSHFAPIMPEGSSVLSLTYIASTSVIPGYGGGMSSAKAALESDIRTLAFEAGRKYGIRVNAISAGPYASRAAKAIGFIDKMITYNENNSPLNKSIDADDVANTALFLLSNLGKGVTGAIVPVDCGMNIMGAALDSRSLQTVE